MLLILFTLACGDKSQDSAVESEKTEEIKEDTSAEVDPEVQDTAESPAE